MCHIKTVCEKVSRVKFIIYKAMGKSWKYIFGTRYKMFSIIKSINSLIFIGCIGTYVNCNFFSGELQSY